MIQEFVDRFMAGKASLEATFSAKHPDDYEEIVKAVVDLVRGDAYDHMDPQRITTIDHGDYQGTLLFVIAGSGYQPSEFWYVTVSYGSCSGCDTMEAIRNYSDDVPTAQQVKDYMTLALHIVQGIKKLDSEDQP